MWWLAAAQALPYVMSAFDQGPNIPGGRVGMNLPDRSNYQKMLLESGFNPQSELYRIAQANAMSSINQDLLNRGIAMSSAGDQAKAGASASLANKFLENELARRQQAFQTVTNYDLGRQNAAMGVGQAQEQQAWREYAQQQQQAQAPYKAIAGIGGIAGGVYDRYTGQQDAAAARSQQQANFDRYMEAMSNRAPSGGQYSYAPGGSMLGMDYSMGGR